MVVTKHMESFTPGTVSPEVLKKGVDKIRKLLIPKSRQTHAARTTQAPFPQVQTSQLPDKEAYLEAIRPPQSTGSQDHRRRSRWTSQEERMLIQAWWSVLGEYIPEGLTQFLHIISVTHPDSARWVLEKSSKTSKKGLLYYISILERIINFIKTNPSHEDEFNMILNDFKTSLSRRFRKASLGRARVRAPTLCIINEDLFTPLHILRPRQPKQNRS